MGRPNETLFHRILRHREETPDFSSAHFLDAEGELVGRMTLREWVEKASAFAAGLERRGVGAGDRVILSLPTSEEFVIAFLGLWWVGAVPVPLPEPSMTAKKAVIFDRFLKVIADCSPKGVVVLDKALAEDAAKSIEGIKVWGWSDLMEPSCGRPMIERPHSPGPDHIAFLQYTSGSTGSPKGVVVTHSALQANLRAAGEGSGITSQDKILTWVPVYHDLGLIGGILYPAFWRIPFYLMSPLSFLAQPCTWLKTIAKHRITLSTAPNFAYSLCARRIDPKTIQGLDLSCWRLAYNGSEPIDAETLEVFHQKFEPFGFSRRAFYPVFGMAEATLAVTFPFPGTEIRVERVLRHELMQKGRAVTVEPGNENGEETISFVSCGRALPGHRVEIKDPTGDLILEEREVGEICFYGPSICPGYYHEVGDSVPREKSELRTGDLGYLADGHLYVVDRLKDVIQIAGTKYYPSDLEREVQRIPGVRTGRVTAFGVPDTKIGTSAVVIVAEIAPGTDEARVRKSISSRLYSTHGVAPKEIVLATDKAIPLTSSGKLMRRKCRETYLRSRAA